MMTCCSFINTLQIYDVNGDGCLGLCEVVQLINDLRWGKIEISQAQRLISLVDKNGDGKISCEGIIELYTLE